MDLIKDNKNEDSALTYAVIEFGPKCSRDIKLWLSKRLEAPKSLNGSEFTTKFTKNLKGEEVYLHVSATTKRYCMNLLFNVKLRI